MANRNGKHLLHVRSNQLVEGKPKLPTIDDVDYGEIAINYADGNEKLSLKSSENIIRTISTDEQNDAKFETKERVAEIDEVTSKAFDTMNKSCGFNEEMTYQPQNELISSATSLSEAIELVAERANSGIDTSDLATKEELTQGLSTKQDKGDYALKSDLTDFITASVDNLVNYYKKSETYTKGEVDSLINAITIINFEVVSVLPESGEANKIYLVPNETQGEQNVKDEYIWIENKWELIGSTQIDLSNYYTKGEVDGLVNVKLDTATYNVDKATFALKSELELLVTKEELTEGLASKADVTRVAEIDEVTSKAFDTMNKSCGFNEEMTYIPQNELIQGTTSLAEAIEKVAEKANSGVDTSTLATKQELTEGLSTKQDKGDYALKSELPTIVQTTGTSETDVMSQKAVSDELNKKIEDAPSDGFYYTRRNGEWVRDNDNLAIIEIDQTISDPATMISGDVNNGAIQWIRKNSHRVLAKKTGDGTVTYMELDDNNSNKYAYDGSAAATDGTEGDVFVKLPTFYYKGTEGDNVKLYFSLSKIDDEYVEWDTNTLIGAYEAYYGDGKLQSCSGVESSDNITHSNFKSYAAARGKGYQLVDWQMHCVLGCLFYAMYGNTNSQTICGSGTNSYTKICGKTNSLGMNDTKAETNGNTMSINFWGLENWWGNKYEWIEGIEGIGKDTVQILSPDPSSGRTFTWYNNPTYGKHYRFGKYLDLSSDVTESGSDSTYYCDYNYGPTSSARVVRRSFSIASTYGGVSCADAGGNSSNTSASSGSRLAFRGVASKAESVEAFKSLPIEP